MRISQSRIEVLLEDIEYDVIDYLRCLLGEANTPSLKRKICDEIADYLTSYDDELDRTAVVCDASNNPPGFAESGRLQVDIALLIDGKEFPGTFLVGPKASGDGANVDGVFKLPAPKTRTLQASWTIEPMQDLVSIGLDEIDETESDIAMFEDASGDERCPCMDCQAYYKESENFESNMITKMADEMATEIDREIMEDLMKLSAPINVQPAVTKVSYDFTGLDQVFTKKPSIYPAMPNGLASTLGL